MRIKFILNAKITLWEKANFWAGSKKEFDNLSYACHEAGHCMIAKVIGAPCLGLSTIRLGDRVGYFKGGDSDAEGDTLHHHTAMMAFAGMIAEELLSRKSILKLSATDAIRYKQVEKIKGQDFTTRAYYSAKKIISANWPLVMRLGVEVYIKKKLDKDQISKILDSEPIKFLKPK